jgi:hypothetical protein
METLINLLKETDIDQVKLAACLAAFLFNWRAIIIAAAWALDLFLYGSVAGNVDLYAWLVVVYGALAVNIKFPSSIRNAILSISGVNWLMVVDYSLFNFDTWLMLCYPFIINAIDAYIIWQLLSNGGRQGVGLFFDAAQNFIFARIFRILPLQKQAARQARARNR